MALRVVYKNKKEIKINRNYSGANAEEQVMNEIKEMFRKKANRKYGIQDSVNMARTSLTQLSNTSKLMEVHKDKKPIKKERDTDPRLLDAEEQMMNDIKESFKKMMERHFKKLNILK